MKPRGSIVRLGLVAAVALAPGFLFAGVVNAAETAPQQSNHTSLSVVRQQYQASPGKKALAVAGDESNFVYGMAHSAQTDVAATAEALDQCNESREARRIDPACEIVELNGATVTRGREIKQAALARSHPLYLWKYTSSTATVYLAGSIHVLKQTLYPLPPQLEQAFQASDHIAVEVDTFNIDPRLMQQKVRQYAMLPAGQTLSTVLPPTVFKELQAFLTDQGIDLNAVATLKPSILATQLAVTRLMALGYLPEFGMERHFVTRAGKRPILELETLDEQLDLLANPPMTLQGEMLSETLQQMEDIEPIIAQMIKAWLLGDDAEFMRLFELQSGESEAFLAFMQRLLDERNVGMADKVQSYLATQGTYFVLVGSAHLSGREGVVALLNRRGMTGRRMLSNDS